MSASRELLDRYQAEPCVFFEEALKFKPYSLQAEIANAVRDNDRVAVRACNASGKTATASAVMLWWLAGGPGSIAVSTSATERQLRRVLWREVRQRCRDAREFLHGAQVTDLEVFFAANWYAIGMSVDETEALQGFHADRVLVIVDEASGVDERTFEAVDGLMAGGESKLLLLGNPLRTSGTFYDAFTKNRAEWKTITISAYDTPNLTGEDVPKTLRRRLVSKRWVERAAKRGTDSNEFRIRVLGEFPKESDDGVVSLGDLEQAHAQTLEPGLPLIIGADIARFGSDETVLAVREGNRIRVVNSYSGRDLMQTCGEITKLAQHLLAVGGVKPTIVVDDVGLGGGVTDRLRELNEFKIVAFNAAAKASSRQYPNARSEAWMTFGEALSELDLDPADEQLSSDLLAPVYALQSDAKRVVEQKKDTKRRLRRSPDRADAVILTCVVDRPRGPGRSARRKPSLPSVPQGRIPGVDRGAFARRYRDPAIDALAAVGIRPFEPGIGGRATTSEPVPTAAARTGSLIVEHDPVAELNGYLGIEGAE